MATSTDAPPACPLSLIDYAQGDIIEDRSREHMGVIKKYKTGKLLGKGGFAKCFEMISNDSGKTYAGKIVPRATLKKESAKQKLLNEIKIHKSLDHPHIVRFERFFEDSDNVYILLEVCRSQTMMELLKMRKRLTEPEVRYYMLQMLQTLRYLHEQNVIHRDLKLGNLFLGDSMNIKVGDFGLAAKLDFTGDKKKTVCGTPNYIAPEILEAKHGHSFEVDIWSLGIRYTLLIGKPPFETTNVKSTYKRIRSNQYSFPPYIQISSEAINLIQSILQLEPEKRPSIDMIQSHPFMLGETPMSMPSSALLTQPVFKRSELYFPTAPFSQPQKNVDNDVIMDLNADKENICQNTQLKDKNKETAIFGKASSPAKQVRVKAESISPFASSRLQQVTQNAVSKSLAAADTFINGNAKISTTNVFGPPNFRGFNMTNSKQPELTLQELKSTGRDSPNGLLHFSEMTLKDPRSFSAEVIRANDLEINENPLRSKPAMDQQEMDDENGSLRQLHRELEVSLARQLAVNNNAVKLASPPQLELWVSKWVDYTEKYGLGYLLSNGSVGVFFNDSTKIVQTPELDAFEYMDRRHDNEKVVRYSMGGYPAELQKKVTLLKHFRKYLVQENTTGTNNSSSSNSNTELVHIKRWLRTKHAILFRLSNRAVQINFLDHTELILSSVQNVATFTDKSGHRSSYVLSSLLENCPTSEISRRVKYAKDILHYMINSNQK